MNTKQFHRRVWAMVALLAMIITGMGAALYDLQINNGEGYYDQTQKKIADKQSVPAARGQILDRNGQVLVSNQVVYQVTLETSRMGEERGEILLSLMDAARLEGVEWTDNLPITNTAPFRFTTDMPYYTIVRDEDGGAKRSLTRLGRLAVHMKWIDDPTRSAEPEEESVQTPQEPGLLDKLKRFLKGETAEPEPLKEPEEIGRAHV